MRLLSLEEPVYGYVFDGHRYDIGTKVDWFKAHLELSLMREDFRGPLEEFIREWLKDG